MHQQIALTDNPGPTFVRNLRIAVAARERASERPRGVRYLRATEYIIPKISVRTIREKARTTSKEEVCPSAARVRFR